MYFIGNWFIKIYIQYYTKQLYLHNTARFRFRSQQLEKYVKAMENQRMKMGSGSGSSSGGGGSGSASRELPTVTTHVGKKVQAITVEITRLVTYRYNTALYLEKVIVANGILMLYWQSTLLYC